MGALYVLRTYLTLSFLLLAFLFGCKTEPDMRSSEGGVDIEYTKLSNTNAYDQQISNEAKHLLKKHKEITVLKGINTKKDLVMAFEVEQLERFHLNKLEKNYKKELKKKFPDMQIEISSDKKAVLELDQLEQALKEKDITEKELKKRIHHLIKLMKEKT